MAVGRDGGVVTEGLGVQAKTARRECLAERALVGTIEPVDIGLDPSITSGEERRVARLKRERVHEEVEENGVSALGVGVCGRVGGEALLRDERGVDLVEHVGPNFTDVVDLVELLQTREAERVRRRGGRVREAADALGVVDDELAHDVVGDSRTRLLGPVCHRVRPALTHTTSLGGLEAATGTTAGETVGDAVGHLVDNNVVLKGTIAEGVGDVEQEHAHLTGLAVGGRREVGVVGASGVLDGDRHTVIGTSTLSIVVVLEAAPFVSIRSKIVLQKMNVLERSLREAVAVGNVVHGVDDVERVGTRDVDVRSSRRLLLQVVGEVEDEVGRRLLRGNLCPARSLE